MAPTTEPRESGKLLRKDVPRKANAAWTQVSAGDRDPVALLEAQAAARVAELVPIRYGRMLQSPFAFYRGAAAVMAHDLSSTPSTGLAVQLCGDAHLANFGGFSAPDRSLIFDVNDFDETLPGPFEWDIKRLVASFAVAGRVRGMSPATRADFVREVVTSYGSAMKSFADQQRLDVWYARLDAAELQARFGQFADQDTVKRFEGKLHKAEGRTNARAFSRYSTLGADGKLRPISQPPLVVPLDELFQDEQLAVAKEVVSSSLQAYIKTLEPDRQVLLSGYEIVGFARKVVGVGSVGTRCWIVLMVAKDDQLDDLVLQVKEAGPSVMEEYLKPSAFDNSGRRVVEGQRLMQASSDVLLGWHRTVGTDGQQHDYYVRQMWDGKVSADLTKLPAAGFQAYAGMCGWTLARAHARSGDRKAIAGYVGSGATLAEALVTFAESYADQNDADFALLRKAADDKSISVEQA